MTQAVAVVVVVVGVEVSVEVAVEVAEVVDVDVVVVVAVVVVAVVVVVVVAMVENVGMPKLHRGVEDAAAATAAQTPSIAQCKAAIVVCSSYTRMLYRFIVHFSTRIFISRSTAHVYGSRRACQQHYRRMCNCRDFAIYINATV